MDVCFRGWTGDCSTVKNIEKTAMRHPYREAHSRFQFSDSSLLCQSGHEFFDRFFDLRLILFN